MVENHHAGQTGTGVLSQPVLIPLDGTEIAEGILPYVCQVARARNLPLILHGVVDPGAIEYPASLAPHDPSPQQPYSGVYGQVVYRERQSSQAVEDRVVYKDQVDASALAHAAERLRAVASRLEDEGVNAQVKTTMGGPAEEILRVAAEERCGLIAMSTHGRNAIGRTILGSVTDRIIRSSTVPVLTIAPEKAETYRRREGVPLKRIMLPLDGSLLAEQAIPYVEALARALSLVVILVRAVSLEYPVFAYPVYSQLQRFTEDRDREAASYLKGVSRDLTSRGLTVRTAVLRGWPAQSLLDFADRTPNDMIAITTHGRSGLSRWMTGSVADALVRASGDPVLVVRPV